MAVPIFGICLCIRSKRMRNLGEPLPQAWLACVILFCAGGPLIMWIPFVMDSCYANRQYGGAYGTTVVTTQHVCGHGHTVQPIHAQPVVAAAVPVVAQAQPVMAAVVAQPAPAGPATATVVAVNQQP